MNMLGRDHLDSTQENLLPITCTSADNNQPICDKPPRGCGVGSSSAVSDCTPSGSTCCWIIHRRSMSITCI